MIKFTVYGEPVAKGRARSKHVKTKGGKEFTMHYTPEKTRLAEHDIKLQATPYMPKELLIDAILLGVKIYRSIPKSFGKKKRAGIENGTLRPITKPDSSNYIKLVEDAFNGLFWKDDSQVVGYLEGTGKYYSDRPRIEIEIKEL